MLITFSSSQNDSKTIHLEYPKNFSSNDYLVERDSFYLASWGKLQIKECWFEGVCFFCSHFFVKQRACLNLQCDSFCWLMNFVLEGELKSEIAAQQIHLVQNQFHTFCCSSLNADLILNQNAKVFTICLTRSFIQKLLGKDAVPECFRIEKDAVFTEITKGTYSHKPISRLIKEILEAEQPYYIRRIFLEAKILELLSLQLEMQESRQKLPEKQSHEDIKRLHRARILVEENIKVPCSLIELARKTGLNDFKLKKGFKTLFGNTVFGYLNEIRMETAYRFLKEGKSVNEVAEAVGYKNAHHFTAAFKKKYKILPSKVELLYSGN